MTPLQTLIINRLAELDLTYRAAAVRSGGLISHGTLHQYAMGNVLPDRIGERVKKGIALALDVKLSVVEEAVLASTTVRHTEFKLSKKADRLSPKQRKAVVALVNALLDDPD